ncbi:hypothetical protein [Streptomyces sp. BE303]|uniref:hypothetical protein n=1 Tax=Streptomyces sp. BE303 TaxID=3002528 RepID=UPI003FA6EF6D
MVAETGRTLAEVARDLGNNETALATWVSPAPQAGGTESGQSSGFELRSRCLSDSGGRVFAVQA